MTLFPKFIKSGLWPFFFILVLAACSKSKDPDPIKDFITFDGKEYPINFKAYDDYDDLTETGGHVRDLILTSVSQQEYENQEIDCKECEHIHVGLAFVSASEEFKTGTYTPTIKSDSMQFSGALSIGSIENFDKENAEEVYVLSDGTITISGSAPQYKLVIDATTEDGKKLIGEVEADFIDYTNVAYVTSAKASSGHRGKMGFKGSFRLK